MGGNIMGNGEMVNRMVMASILMPQVVHALGSGKKEKELNGCKF